MLKVDDCDTFKVISFINFFLVYAVEWEELFYENQATKFKVHTKMSSRIGVLRIFPGITPEAVSTNFYP